MKINKLSPNFAVKNVYDTVGYYKENFGFSLVVAVPSEGEGYHQSLEENIEYAYAIVKRDDTKFMFQHKDSFKEDVEFVNNDSIHASVSFYMNVTGIDDFYEQLKAKDLELTELNKTWYGMKEFYVKDLNGYILAFAEDIRE